MVRLSSTRRLVLPGILVLAAACSGDAVAPHAHAGQGADPVLARGLHGGKYRDTGVRPATGRSGSATLAGRASMGADGVTTLTLTTGSLDNLSVAPGQLSKVQIKATGPRGERLFTQNYKDPSSTGLATFTFRGLPRGTRLEVQANVRGIDGRRTDVVTLTETVSLRAALTVDLNLPAQVLVGVPAVVTATVREQNGDAGDYTGCSLYVDGVRVDAAQNIWVDAGDAVTCAFTYTFLEPGTPLLEVRLNGASDSGTVSVLQPNPAASSRVTFADRTVQTLALWDYNWRDAAGTHQEYDSRVTDGTREQTLSLVGTLPRATAFPVRGTLEIRSGGSLWQANDWTGLEAAADGSGRLCADQMIADQGGHLYVCSTGAGLQGSTTFGYTRFSGTVTYHSVGFLRRWDNVAGQETYWSWNDGYETQAGGGQHRTVGSDIAVRLRFSDAVGDFSAEPVFAVSAFDRIVSETPRTCVQDSPYWLYGGVRTECRSGQVREFGWQGAGES
ncbi:MAG TPA: hypothetical protein VF665_20205 [Longimicrobium sp.]|jgi:hypothetical protein|uniref:hypothetical protein n=1 Tax=Longimicrobium sp. TaxID=2029185 RepID=UPI002EDB35D8